MARLLALMLLSLSAAAGDWSIVDPKLKQLIKDAVKSAGVKINIPPDHMTEKSVNISTINGVSVCDSKVGKNVTELQNEFSKSPALRTSISIYGALVKTKEGELTFVSGDSPEINGLIGECKYLFVSVW